ncbi:hypothetical protein IDM48_11560 [Rothia amarae]|uniref:HK97 gp10 family phage protein n=1 Tax=Rothia amarae TaxID=169480 RepID=A0A7S7B0G5_9MICC|nr:hypothetical protein [Rothia amarae]QOW64958.1 hypothetical protein IDM48_11560 [Rothia amarae]
MELKLNRKGVGEILRSPELRKVALDRAQKIANASGEGYAATSRIGSKRARASVFTESREARLDNAKRQTILRNVGAGR